MCFLVIDNEPTIVNCIVNAVTTQLSWIYTLLRVQHNNKKKIIITIIIIMIIQFFFTVVYETKIFRIYLMSTTTLHTF